MEKTHPKKLHVGMRMIKTAAAVCLCGVFDYFRGSSPFYSMIAAIISTQPTAKKSVQSGMNRCLGTIIGGALALGLLALLRLIGIDCDTLPYYAICSVCIIPVMLLCVALHKEDAISITCIVFLVVLLKYSTSDIGPVLFTIERVLDTLAGVLIALLVNIALPFEQTEEK